MTTSVLSELFGGKYRSRILELLYLHPDESFHLRGIAAKTGVPPASLHALLPRLSATGLINAVVMSGAKRYQANINLPGAEDLRRLMSRYALPIDRLKDTANSLKEITAAAVFGSYASETARANSDIDILIVGDISRVEAQAAFNGLARELKREINVTTLSSAEFRQQSRQSESFISSLLAKPYLSLVGNLDATEKH